MKEIMLVVTEKREFVSLDESKLMVQFGTHGLSEFVSREHKGTQ